MAEPQLIASERAVIRSLRVDSELTFVQIAEKLGIDTSTAHRVYTNPDYQFSGLVLIRIRKGLARLAEEQRDPVGAATSTAARRRRA